MSDETWLERVVTTLRAPVKPEADLAPAIMARIKGGSSPVRDRPTPWLVGALAAAIALLVGRKLTVRPEVELPQSGTAVAFEIQASATKVTLVGDFNGWDRAGTPLARKGGSDRWRTTVALPKGVYRYAFLVDDARWVSDPRRAAPVDHEFGQPSSLLTVR